MMRIPDDTTKAFIGFNSIDVSMKRRKKVTVAGGGWKWVTDRVLPTQKARLVYSDNRSNVTNVTLPSGQVVTIEASLVFQQGGDVRVGDQADVDDVLWEVARVLTLMTTRAEVFRLG